MRQKLWGQESNHTQLGMLKPSTFRVTVGKNGLWIPLTTSGSHGSDPERGNSLGYPWVLPLYKYGSAHPSTTSYLPQCGLSPLYYCHHHFYPVLMFLSLLDLAHCQSNLVELSKLLQNLEILQRTQSAPNFTDMQVNVSAPVTRCKILS